MMIAMMTTTATMALILMVVAMISIVRKICRRWERPRGDKLLEKEEMRNARGSRRKEMRIGIKR